MHTLPFHCGICGGKLDLSRPRKQRCPVCSAKKRSRFVAFVGLMLLAWVGKDG